MESCSALTIYGPRCLLPTGQTLHLEDMTMQRSISLRTQPRRHR